MEWFVNQTPVMQGLLATLFTYSITMLGAAPVFFVKNVNKKIMDIMMGFAAGVMIAASYWSLLNPAIELAEKLNKNAALTAAFGFLAGGLFIVISDMLLNRGQKEKYLCRSETTGHSTEKNCGKKRCILLTTAVTMHNIPEGLAVGVAFGSAALDGSESSLVGAIMLAVGIGIQNFPEGTCVAMPLRREGCSRLKSFLIGQSSGLVEPFAGVTGVLFALAIESALSFALSFSAGAMIAVVCAELIPESFRDNKRLATAGVLAGFIVMMVLDVALG